MSLKHGVLQNACSLRLSCSVCSDSVLPVIRVTVHVHHREDENLVCFDTVEYAVRKTIGQTTADIVFKPRPHSGIVDDFLDRQVDLDGEILPETGFAALIVVYGLVEFGFSFLVKGETHFSKRSRILAKTCSPGTAFARLERSSARRRFATSAHFRSIFVSGALRLRRRESTTIALSSTGRHSASCIMSAVLGISYLMCSTTTEYHRKSSYAILKAE